MFLLPSGDNPSQGSSKSDPIILAADTAEPLRGFLLIAYADRRREKLHRPLEFQVPETRPDQIPMFIHCAHFAHRYNIIPLFLAALKAIVHVIDTKPPLDRKIYISLLELSSLCETVTVDGRTCKYKIDYGVEWCWIRPLHTERSFSDLSETLDAAEKYELTSLLAFCSSCYLEKMAEDPPGPTADGITAPFHNHPWLKATHRLRILSGAWSLERAWVSFVEKVPEFPPDYHCPKKNHATVCVQRWEKEWHRAAPSPAVLAYPTGNICQKFLVLEKEIKSTL
ncbi:hypothetical protein C8R44DRAFT_726002 [Mycena epipterygia]|nr:hypothetical protein C8R44DRAFT_726002 [Mycena epipterygia]